MEFWKARPLSLCLRCTDKTGLLGAAEVVTAVRAWGDQIPLSDVEDMMSEIDVRDIGDPITTDEASTARSTTVQPSASGGRKARVTVDFPEFVHMFVRVFVQEGPEVRTEESKKEQELQAVFNAMDKDGDTMIG